MSDSKEIAAIQGEIVRADMPEMHENLRKVVEQLDDLIAEQHAANIMALWSVGNLLREIDTNPENYLTEDQQRRHIAPSALLLQAYDRVYTAEQFSTAARLFDSYPSKGAIAALVNKRCPTRPNWRITASHVQLLLTVADEGQRQVIEERCVKEAYTTKALAVELSELHGKERKTRDPVAPKGLKQQVYDLLEHQRKFLSRSEKLWLEDGGLYDSIMTASPSQLTDTIKGYINEIRDNFEKMQRIVDIHHSLCGKILVHIQDAAGTEEDDSDSDSEDEPAVDTSSSRKFKPITR
jgi:hypothetical protein